MSKNLPARRAARKFQKNIFQKIKTVHTLAEAIYEERGENIFFFFDKHHIRIGKQLEVTSLKIFFHLSVTGYCHVQATSVDTSWVSIQSITHFPFFIYVKQMHFPIERDICLIGKLVIPNFDHGHCQFGIGSNNICKVNNSYLYNPNCRNGYGKSDTYLLSDWRLLNHRHFGPKLVEYEPQKLSLLSWHLQKFYFFSREDLFLSDYY